MRSCIKAVVPFLVAVISSAVIAGSLPFLHYTEERPNESTIEITIESDGVATISVKSRKDDCPEAWDSRCWTKSQKKARLKTGQMQEIKSLLKTTDFVSIPRQEAVLPGSARLHLVARQGENARIEALSGVDEAIKNTAFCRLRSVILMIMNKGVKSCNVQSSLPPSQFLMFNVQT